MARFPWNRTWPVFALLPFLPLAAQDSGQTAPTSDQVFKNIVVFKGVPAKDLIPAMEFMSGSLKIECTDCHDESDYSKDTRMKQSAREMITMVRDINAKHFGGRNQVTCMTCHNESEHPSSIPLPPGIKLRHQRFETTLKPADLFKKHIAATGPELAQITRTGTMTSPTGPEHKVVSGPVTMVQAPGGKFLVTSNFGKFGSDGSVVWRDGMPLSDEPAHIFGRMGRSWRGANAFDGLERTSIAGKEAVGKSTAIVVRGTRTATGSTEELYFDEKSGLLVRMVSLTRSTLGSVPTVYDYDSWKSANGAKVPMKVTVTFAGGGTAWAMQFKEAKVADKADGALFEPHK